MTTESELDELMQQMKSLSNPANIAGMARFGINSTTALGLSMPVLRNLAGKRHDHALAEGLWQTGVHEARILAGLVEIPRQVTAEQMDRWVQDFDSWDVCDQICLNVFGKTPYAIEKVYEWSQRPEEFIKRAGFVLMAVLAVHDKKATDELFEGFLLRIQQEANDERNFVKKATNWALRQIGKRNPALRLSAIAAAREIQKMPSAAARWVAADALRELEGRLPKTLD